MFSVNCNPFGLPRWRLILSFFLLFCFGGGCILLFFLWSVRGSLHSHEMDRANRLLDSYLEQQQVPGIGNDIEEERQDLGDLLFIRVIRSGSHVVKVDEGERQGPAFRDLMAMAPGKSGAWVKVGDPDHRTVLNIVSRPLAGGGLIQVGIIAGEAYQLYCSLVRSVMIGGGLVLFLSWPLAIACTGMAVLPLRHLQQTLDALEYRHDSSGSLGFSGVPEMDAIESRIANILHRNKRLLEEMQASLDSVAHDLRTPMTRLRSMAEYGLQGGDDSGRLRESLSDCLEESERVLEMLGIMMRVAEAESGVMRLDLAVIDLHRSIADVAEMYNYVAEEKDITIKVEIAQGLQIQADRVRISQVWGNLLANAIKYGRKGGWVEIGAYPDDDHLQIDFRDNGIGISQNEIGRIWERLYRGDRSRSQPGLGLGLSYVKAVVEAHGGQVLVTSTLHQGSCFSVLLPGAVQPISGETDRQVKSQTSGA